MRAKGMNKKILAGILVALCAVQGITSCFFMSSLEAKTSKPKNDVDVGVFLLRHNAAAGCKRIVYFNK